MPSSSNVYTSPSETTTLSTRGYKLLKRMGEGSYAKVYLSEFRPPDSPPDIRKTVLACKLIDTSRAPRDFVKKFLPRELDVLIRLNHPHIIHVHSIFQRKAKYFIFMRFAENGDLLDFILKHGAVAESQARVWLRQMALAIQYLHTMNLAHRDLKCENVLITANFNVKLADFGFARFVVDSAGKEVFSETYCGSLSYAAPEVLRGQPYAPKIADTWSLGVVLYVMLNKAMPFDDTNIKRLFEQQNNRRWRFRAKVIDILSDQVKKLVTSMLEPDVKKRIKIDNIVDSEWVAMDARLTKLTPAEQAAYHQAEDENVKMSKATRKSRQSEKHKDELMLFKEMPSVSSSDDIKGVTRTAASKSNENTPEIEKPPPF